MYTYYLLAAMGPSFQPYLWWKKYLTAFQMLQFIAIMVHAFQLLFVQCDYPKAFVWWIGMHAVMFFFLFRDFYRQSYATKKRNAGQYYYYYCCLYFFRNFRKQKKKIWKYIAIYSNIKSDTSYLFVSESCLVWWSK